MRFTLVYNKLIGSNLDYQLDKDYTTDDFHYRVDYSLTLFCLCNPILYPSVFTVV